MDLRAFDLKEARAVLLHNRVPVDGEVFRSARDREGIAAAAPLLIVDVGERVGADDNRSRLTARVRVVGSENLGHAAAVPHEIVLEDDVTHLAPWACSVL